MKMMTDTGLLVEDECAPAAPPTVKSLMQEIVRMDVQPSVFKAFVCAADHFEGFQAWVAFRDTVDDEGPSVLITRGESPEAALTALRDNLRERFGKCPHCGGYRNGDGKE